MSKQAEKGILKKRWPGRVLESEQGEEVINTVRWPSIGNQCLNKMRAFTYESNLMQSQRSVKKPSVWRRSLTWVTRASRDRLFTCLGWSGVKRHSPNWIKRHPHKGWPAAE